MFNLIATYFFSMFTIGLINALQGNIALDSMVSIPMALILAIFVFFIFKFDNSKYLFAITYVVFAIPDISVDLVAANVMYLTFGWLTLFFKEKFKSVIYAGKANVNNQYFPATTLQIDKDLTSKNQRYYEHKESKKMINNLDRNSSNNNSPSHYDGNNIIHNPSYHSLSVNIHHKII